MDCWCWATSSSSAGFSAPDQLHQDSSWSSVACRQRGCWPVGWDGSEVNPAALTMTTSAPLDIEPPDMRGTRFGSPVARAVAAYGLLLLAWLLSIPPFSAPDEWAHYLRVLGLAQGTWIGEKVPR